MTEEKRQKIDDDYIFLDRETVKKKLLLKSDTSLYDLIRNNGFPLPVKLGRRRSGWRLSEVHEWMDKQPRSSDIRRK